MSFYSCDLTEPLYNIKISIFKNMTTENDISIVEVTLRDLLYHNL